MVISFSWSAGAWRNDGSGERAAPGLCSLQSVPQTRMPGLGRGGGDSQNLRTFHANQGPIPRILHLRDQGSREADPTSSLLAHPAQRPAVTAGMLEGTQAWEEGRRSGDAACERGGAWGRGLGKARRGGAWPQRPRPAAAPQPGLLFRSPLGPDPRGSSGSGNRHPRTALPGPRATLSRSRRQSWSGCRIPAGPPHHSFLWLDIWKVKKFHHYTQTLPVRQVTH